jgi:hypothetical protein
MDALKLADRFRKQANQAIKDHDEATGKELLQKCLEQEKIAYGSDDPLLLFTLARLIALANGKGETDQETADYLNQALTIFGDARQRSEEVVRVSPNALPTWRPLAYACFEFSKKSKGTTKQEYLEWSCNFYDLAVKAWGSKPNDDDYYKLIRYRRGDRTKAKDLHRELQTAGQPLPAANGGQPADQEQGAVQGAAPDSDDDNDSNDMQQNPGPKRKKWGLFRKLWGKMEGR